ncbi:hypothetical protein DFQ28_011286 [Apophysomyces sp. BC1034]|nr:hypothetical protein DFQ30_010904 [Apophysomyces sp. BC1015]KAG0181232.1 hypothetical protein DFQ29_008935 [Apophysomyces sp. BC1021]KAG0191686.1 hypothetical protein DFQ28_011286 [Apophysomyces sp. BC1034]
MTNSPHLVKFDHQVAGHDQLLQLATNDLIVVKPCTQTEIVFYEASQQYPEFDEFIPECYGSLRAATESEKHMLEIDAANNNQVNQDGVTSLPLEHLCLENILRGFTRPSILDLKIGDKLYDDFADEAKREKMTLNAKNTTIETLALRISGMKVYDTVEREYKIYRKKYGRMRTNVDVIDAFLAYFFPLSSYGQQSTPDVTMPDNQKQDGQHLQGRISSKKMIWILESFIDDLNDIQEFVATHPQLELTGSSLLFVYEGDKATVDKVWKRMLDEDKGIQLGKMDDEEKEEEEEEEEPPAKMCDLRLIDFAHSRWNPARSLPDEGVLKGMNNMVGFLRQCLERLQLENL